MIGAEIRKQSKIVCESSESRDSHIIYNIISLFCIKKQNIISSSSIKYDFKILSRKHYIIIILLYFD